MRFLLSIMAVFLLSSAPALAEGRVVDGDTPNWHGVSPVSQENQVDIYARHFEYARQRLEFRQDLEARRESYATPHNEAFGDYQRDLTAFNANRTDWRGLD